MAVDAMDVDSSPAPAAVAEPERKRKHKHKDQSSKKKRKHDSNLTADETTVHETTSKKSSKSKEKSKQKSSEDAPSTSDSPYVLTTATLYLPLSPISISPTHALASLLAEHLSPLLLTYYPPLQGVVLAYSNASISSEPPSASSPSSDPQDNPQPLTLAKTADEYGVLYVYLTATFLVFRPQRGQILEGWVNVQSEGFLGAVVLNLFSVGIERKRLPSNWKWVPPGEEEEDGFNSGEKPKKKVFSSTEDEDDSEPSSRLDPEKEHFKPISLASDANPFSETMDLNNGSAEDDESAAEGYFQSVSGHRVRGTVRFRVVDIDVIPGSDRERGFLSIEGTMLSPEEEARVLEDERNGNYSSMTPRRPQGQWEPSSAMSGALAKSTSAAPETQFSTADADADADAGALEESPSKKKARKTEKEKEKKSKSSKSKKKKEEK
ncbi:DNA-directed RNA polymerase I subunit RPA43 [Aspergillus udagawae]|uniref:DNA-directed RNA polymerase subunit n=1 Tax=Aspergillus udagawae TaxID=91492 RepID=A0ABQ1B7R1_9EURO|nr:DNA-directed RNA polymerase I subunit RPA43 [Aspergillus udagawae]GFF95521.1 DNA-directed RNA polymerase I subunit RPA43 [Aspergillus udagawae]GFG06595.1 DNA-directed RNA polymerase I subunit RPA43 [Aspergillus udagawae]GFG26165.1 DNA-directed RNA polymerase I subunit RPA43 [Aspergillus udagawae]